MRGRDGKEVSNADNAVNIVLFSLKDERPAVFMETFLYEKNTEFDTTHPAIFYFGTSMKDAYVLVDVFGQKGRLESRTLSLNDRFSVWNILIGKSMETEFAVQFTFVKNGLLYT